MKTAEQKRIEQKRLEIAKACGWKNVCWNGGSSIPFGDNPKGNRSQRAMDDLPDYFNDLNAMREAWNCHPPSPFTDRFNFQCELAFQLLLIVRRDFESAPNWDRPTGLKKYDDLINAAKNFLIANATASQRAEAFGRTLNLWTE